MLDYPVTKMGKRGKPFATTVIEAWTLRENEEDEWGVLLSFEEVFADEVLMRRHCTPYNAETDFDIVKKIIPHKDGDNEPPEVVEQTVSKRYRIDDEALKNRTLSCKLEAIIASAGIPTVQGSIALSYVINELSKFLKMGLDDSVLIKSGILEIIQGYSMNYLREEFPKYFKGFEAPSGENSLKKLVFIEAFVKWIDSC